MYRMVCKPYIAFDKSELNELGRYRHEVFIKKLKWDLISTSSDKDIELDEFDSSDALYVIVYNENSEIVGCSRLIQTLSPYLLADIFPYLCDGELPKNSLNWEISRYAAHGHKLESTPFDIFKFSMQLAKMHGASNLVAVTTTVIERYFLRKGVSIERLGKVIRQGKDNLVALSFDTDQFSEDSSLNIIQHGDSFSTHHPQYNQLNYAHL
ncbi:GNAT family N-acetyltransferase [Vibrio sp. Of7-15]|uniref:acyl-homoserine-lactone synthase n=1 Tax=Vibrio sp. Of7-15 TaxID=2724879 RepID=UPI001EF2E7CE|nr:acyl-homoserine-lactone synthase [Vibrio sp. Of7-15]MCG7498976.1 GNAT family N-acetyltransferase [Vibrio sp. Of7-15]